jgi:hypothetical protein
VVLGDPKVQARATKLANQRMRREVLPLLSRTHPRPSSWNPLRSDVKSASAYGMKLWLPDALALEILQTPKLMTLTAQICLDAVYETATTREPAAFVTNILKHLMSDDG